LESSWRNSLGYPNKNDTNVESTWTDRTDNTRFAIVVKHHQSYNSKILTFHNKFSLKRENDWYYMWGVLQNMQGRLFCGTGTALLYKTQQGNCEVLVKIVELHISNNRVYTKKRNTMKFFLLLFLADIMEIVLITLYIFIYLFYNAYSNSEYIVSNNKKISKNWIENDLNVSIMRGTVVPLAWRERGLSQLTTSFGADIWTMDLPNNKHEYYPWRSVGRFKQNIWLPTCWWTCLSLFGLHKYNLL
jgi:hypothetical protein